MKSGKIIWGIIIILIGTLLLLKNLGLIFFNWFVFFKLWPLVFIFWGLSILPIKEYIKLILMIIALLFGLYIFQRTDYNIRMSKDDNDEQFNEWDTQTLSEPYDTYTNTAILKFSAAAGYFKINEVTDKLILFNKKGDIGNYNMSVEKNDSTKIIHVELDSPVKNVNKFGNYVTLLLNPNPYWNFDFDFGAADINFDLSKLKIRKLQFDGGASNLVLKLGNFSKTTDIEFNTGASSISISIPNTSGCQLKYEGFLANKNLSGFVNISDNTYQTENFNKASNKIYINATAALSNLTITRY